LSGLADGAGLTFEEAFLQNIPLEFTSCSPKLAPKRKTPDGKNSEKVGSVCDKKSGRGSDSDLI